MPMAGGTALRAASAKVKGGVALTGEKKTTNQKQLIKNKEALRASDSILMGEIGSPYRAMQLNAFPHSSVKIY